MVRPPRFEPGSSAWQADVLTKLDYGRPRQSSFSNTIKTIPTKTEENIINILIKLKGNGKSEGTIKTISYKLKQLARNCDLNNPDKVKQYIANAINQKTKKPLSNATKHKFTVAYDHYCKFIGIQWTKPTYKIAETTPLIPTTENVNAIINHASKKYITIFTILKETGFAPKELADTTRKDIDTEQGIIRVRGVKGHGSGTYKLKPHTAEMLRTYIHKHPKEHPFPNPHAMSQIWVDTRRRASKKLCKPELERIELRNLRNYSASTYYKSLPIRDPIALMRHLRHKKLENTMHYIRAIDIDYTIDENYICRTSTTIEEDAKLIENGFQYITERNGTKLFKKRK
jgi:integrase